MEDLRKLIMHNQILIDAVLSKLGTSDEDISKLNLDIRRLIDDAYKEIERGTDNEE